MVTAFSIYPIDASQLRENGGTYRLQRGPVQVVQEVEEGKIIGGAAVPVYIVTDDEIDNYTIQAGAPIHYVTRIIGDARGIEGGPAIPIYIVNAEAVIPEEPVVFDAVVARGDPLLVSNLLLGHTPTEIHISHNPGAGALATAQALLTDLGPQKWQQHIEGFGATDTNKSGAYEKFETAGVLAGKEMTSGQVTGETWTAIGGTLHISNLSDTAPMRLRPTTTGQAYFDRGISNNFEILSIFNLGADGTARSFTFQFRRAADGSHLYGRVRKAATGGDGTGGCTLDIFQFSGTGTNLTPTGNADFQLAEDTDYMFRAVVIDDSITVEVWEADRSAMIKQMTVTNSLNLTETRFAIHVAEAPAAGMSLAEYMVFQWDWSTFDYRMNRIDEVGGSLVLIAYNAPSWMKEFQSPSDADYVTSTFLHPRYYTVFAQCIVSILKHVEGLGIPIAGVNFWNEMKGGYSPGGYNRGPIAGGGSGMWSVADNGDWVEEDSYNLNNWNYVEFPRAYAAFWFAVKGAYPALPLGGPYTNFSQEWDPAARSGQGGFNTKLVRFHQEFFTRIKLLGADVDIITFDGASVATTEDPEGQDRIDAVFDNVTRTSAIVAHLKEMAAVAVGDLSNAPTSLGGLGVADMPVGITEYYITAYDNPETSARYQGLTDEIQASALAALLNQMVISGVHEAYHWQPQARSDWPYDEDGNMQSLFRDTRSGLGDGTAFLNYFTYKAFVDHFSRGTQIYEVEITGDTAIDGIASDTHIMIWSRASVAKEVEVGGVPVSLPAYGTEVVAVAMPITLGNENLAGWYVAQGDSDSDAAVVTFRGDSWAGLKVLTYNYFRSTLISIFGDGGLGFVPVIGNRDNYSGLVKDTSGFVNVSPEDGGEGPDGSHADSSTIGHYHEVSWSGGATSIVIHYGTQPGGGTLQYQVDGAGDWTDIITDGVAGVATETISGLSDASHTVRIEVKTAAPCRLFGTEWRRATGVRVNNCGYGGSKVSEHAALNQTYWQQHLENMGTHLVVYMMGGNGDEGSEGATMYADMQTLINTAQAAGADVVLCTPGPKAAEDKSWVGVIYRQLQADEGTALVDYGLLLRPWATANALYYSDGLHLNATGAEYVGAYLINNLLLGPYSRPTDLTATANGIDTIDLSWTDTNGGATSTSIERSNDGSTGWAEIATVAPGVTSYSDTGLSQETTRHYRVRAFVGADYSPYSVSDSATTASEVPDAPTLLTATANGASQIDLSWTDNSSVEDGFRIERSSNGSSGWTQIGTNSANDTTYSDTGLTGETTYYYRVYAYNGDQDSGYSNVANATTEAGSSFDPTDVASILFVFSKNTGFSFVTNDPVPQWNDLTGNGRHFVQATGTRQPLYIASAINGHPAIRFDGSNDFMIVDFSYSQPVAVFMVVNFLSFANNDMLWDGATNGVFGMQMRTIEGTVRIFAGTLSSEVAIGTGPHILVARFNGASSSLYAGGGSPVLSGNFGSNGFAGLTLCGNGSRAGGGTANVDVGAYGIAPYPDAASINDFCQDMATEFDETWTNIS